MNISILGGNVKRALKGEYVGGAEKQAALISRGLADLGHNVFVLESSSGPLAKECIGGIEIVQSWCTSKGIPGVRSLTYRLPILYKRLLQTNPKIVYSRGVGIYSAMIAWLLHKSEIKFVWGIAHDQDLNPTIRQVNKASFYTTISNHLMFKLASYLLLKYSNDIICQTKEQIVYLERKSLQNKCHNISNISEIPIRKKSFFNQNKNTCLWVGKFSGTKGEVELLCLAKKMPHINFIAVGHVTQDFEQTSIYKSISCQPNIKRTGRLNYNTLLDLYAETELLVHTAPTEGFSNTFLEGWSFGVPVVSLHVDPNGLLSSERFGTCAEGDIDLMKTQIDRLLNDTFLRSSMGQAAQEYIDSNHSFSTVINQLNYLFENGNSHQLTQAPILLDNQQP